MMTFEVKDLGDLPQVAQQLIAHFENHRIICFYGDMGAGKTTLIKAVCHEMGVSDNVVSPTFALVNQYTAGSGMPIYHFDFYRIETIEEVYDFGYEEYFYATEGVCLIEWPELIEELLPHEGVLRISIAENADGSRTIKQL